MRSSNQGFSTVELLLSLFIAAAFIGAGFQLFSVVTKDSNETRLRSDAIGIANENIQLQSGNVSDVCAPAPATIENDIPVEDLPQASIEITFSCPYGNASRTTRITSEVTYGQDAKTVRSALDVTR